MSCLRCSSGTLHRLTEVAGIGQDPRITPFTTSRSSLASEGLYDPYEGTDHLDDNLTTSPRTVQTEYTRLSNATGPLFRKGDDISFGQIRDGLSRFKNNLMQTIRQSMAAITIIDLNVSSLMGTTNVFRHDNINAMTGLFQRVNVARPIPRTLNPGVVPIVQVNTFGTALNDGSNCWCRQAANSSSLFVCPFCGTSNEASL